MSEYILKLQIHQQEEARIVAWEEKMGNEDQALTVHSKKSIRDNHHHQGKHSHPRISNNNLPKFRCFTCDKRGHYTRDCSRNKNGSHKKKGNKRRHHSHAIEDDEPSTNKTKQ